MRFTATALDSDLRKYLEPSRFKDATLSARENPS